MPMALWLPYRSTKRRWDGARWLAGTPAFGVASPQLPLEHWWRALAGLVMQALLATARRGTLGQVRRELAKMTVGSDMDAPDFVAHTVLGFSMP